MYILLTMNYHMFNLSFVHLRVTLMVRFNANFLLRTNKYYFKTTKQKDNRTKLY